jgi:hypothetical protein
MAVFRFAVLGVAAGVIVGLILGGIAGGIVWGVIGLVIGGTVGLRRHRRSSTANGLSLHGQA